jgi:hypothetical protein
VLVIIITASNCVFGFMLAGDSSLTSALSLEAVFGDAATLGQLDVSETGTSDKPEDTSEDGGVVDSVNVLNIFAIVHMVLIGIALLYLFSEMLPAIFRQLESNGLFDFMKPQKAQEASEASNATDTDEFSDTTSFERVLSPASSGSVSESQPSMCSVSSHSLELPMPLAMAPRAALPLPLDAEALDGFVSPSAASHAESGMITPPCREREPHTSPASSSHRDAKASSPTRSCCKASSPCRVHFNEIHLHKSMSTDAVQISGMSSKQHSAKVSTPPASPDSKGSPSISDSHRNRRQSKEAKSDQRTTPPPQVSTKSFAAQSPASSSRKSPTRAVSSALRTMGEKASQIKKDGMRNTIQNARGSNAGVMGFGQNRHIK